MQRISEITKICFIDILQLREVRNDLMHTKDMKVTAGDLTDYIQVMVKLLEDPIKLLNHTAAIKAVPVIKQVTIT